MRKYIVLLMLVSTVLGISQNMSAIFPMKFTSDFTIKSKADQQQNGTGKIWMQFDSYDKLQNWRVDLISELCAKSFPGVYNCTLIDQENGNWYFFSPEQKICNKNKGTFRISRKFLQPQQYQGIKQIDSQPYHYWFFSGGITNTQYYAQISQTLKPRRISIFGEVNSGFEMDMQTNTYSQTFDSASIFQIPKYCLDHPKDNN